MTKTPDEALRMIMDEINSWDDDVLHVWVADDGGGHVDFMGFNITQEAERRMRRVVEEILGTDLTSPFPEFEDSMPGLAESIRREKE